MLKSVCVYCGSGEGRDEAFGKAADILGHALAAADIRLVYGGGSVGLMGRVARSVLDHDGQVIGIIPKFLKERERMLDAGGELIVTEDMHERKMMMFEKADAFVALPGGAGTLEELVENLTWSQLGWHDKPILIADIARYWSPLIALFEHMRAQHFIHREMDVDYLLATNAEDIVPLLQQACKTRHGPRRIRGA